MNQVLTGALLVLALQCLPGTVTAAPGDPPTTATLMAQAGDPAVIAPAAAATNVAQEQPAEDIFTPEQLEQLVAPIALYADALLAQILMASTYPLEIVEADRWLSPQPDLKGEALEQALMDKDWDPSVKSLTTLPNVLKQMSENLDWTQDLGDAFLAQQNDLMDTVQIMRGKAYESGNLQSTEQQTVTQNPEKIIIIQQASPEVVYVPTYSPTVVYGPAWGYPSYYYPAMYPYYPPGAGLLAFGVGVAVGGAIWGGCNWGWGNNDIDIDINRNTEFNRNTNNNFNGDRGDRGQGNRGQGGKESWKHDASHRKGVNYKSKDVAQRNGANSGSNRATQNQARGRSTSPTASNRAGGQAQNRAGAGGQAQNRAGAGGQAQNRAGAGGQAQNRAAGAGAQTQNRSAASQGNRASSANRNQSAGSSAYKQSGSSGANRSRSGGSNSAFSGSRSPSSDRMSSSRGASSRGASSYGGSRGGGGGSRGGGGRRR